MVEISKEQAIELFGTQVALAEALGISQPAVALWKDGKPIPQKHAYRIRYELKPEAFEGTAA